MESYSISRLKPWELEGISKATWYRRPKSERETSVARVLGIFKAVQELDSQNSDETGAATVNNKHYRSHTCLTLEPLSHIEGKVRANE